jgi:hypothetical protein
VTHSWSGKKGCTKRFLSSRAAALLTHRVLGDGSWGHFRSVEAEVGYTARVSVNVDLDTGEVAWVDTRAPGENDATSAEGQREPRERDGPA